VNLQEVAGGKKFLELSLEAVNFTGYRLIRRTLMLHMQLVTHVHVIQVTTALFATTVEIILETQFNPDLYQIMLLGILPLCGYH